MKSDFIGFFKRNLETIKRKLAYLKRYISYRIRSVNRHGIHSPFAYTLIEEVLKDKPVDTASLEAVRAELLQDTEQLLIQDLGAGSSSGAGDRRRVKDIARLSLSKKSECRILARLIQHLDIEHVVEFGSCLGLSAAYMSQAGAEVISMEGSRALHEFATKKFANGTAAPDFRLGAFDDILPSILAEMPRLDMAFIDGNHTEEATLRYFEMLSPYIKDNSVLIFDDIHWSTGMESAWAAIKSDSRVTLSIDIFWAGLVFFNPGLSGEDFVIRY